MRYNVLFDTLQNLIKRKPSQKEIGDILNLAQTAISGRANRNSTFSDEELGIIEKHYGISLRGEKSIYGVLVSYLDGQKGIVTGPNFDYAMKAKALFDKITEYTPDNCPSAKEFDKQKIFISDNDFEKLDDDMIKIITTLNVY